MPDIESARKLQQQFQEFAALADAYNIVQWLTGAEPDEQKATEWLVENRDGLTADKLREITFAARLLSLFCVSTNSLFRSVATLVPRKRLFESSHCAPLNRQIFQACTLDFLGEPASL